MRNHRPVQPGHATGGGGRGRKEKEKDEEKRKKKGREGKGRRSEIRAYIYIHIYMCIHVENERASDRASVHHMSFALFVPVLWPVGGGGGREHRESFSGPCFYDNEQNWRTCALVSTDNKVHLCNQRLLGGGARRVEKTAARVIMRLAGISPAWMERTESDV